MDVLGQFLDERPDGAACDAAPEERLLKFDSWARRQLDRRLDWAWAGEAKERRIEQCRLYLERMVIELWRRGWMLDGHLLARRIEELLDAVGAYQRKGAVLDFWPYFKTAVDRYVGANAEEIQAEAMRAGSHVSGALAAVLAGAAPRGPALPELVALRAAEAGEAKDVTLRQKLARARARQAACNDDARQGQLL